MTNTNITKFRNNIFKYMDQAIELNDVINVSTKKGNAVVMSEEDYRGLMETLYIQSSPKTVEAIRESRNTPIEECVSWDEVEW